MTFGDDREGECHGQMVELFALQRGGVVGVQCLGNTECLKQGWSEKIGIAVEDD